MLQNFTNNAIDRPDLLNDDRFAKNAARVTNRLALKQELDAVFKTDTVENWLDRLRAAGIPAGAIRSTGEALDSYETEARNLITEVTHTSEGKVPALRSPLHFSSTPVQEPVAAPLLGEHSASVLRTIPGYDDARIQAMVESGILKEPG